MARTLDPNTSHGRNWIIFYVLSCLLCSIYILNLYFTPFALCPICGADDGHFIEQGMSIVDGQWLGSYGELTLIKGPGLPILLALSHLSLLPYSIILGLLEAGSFFFLALCLGDLSAPHAFHS